jgi:hypothetical protein
MNTVWCLVNFFLCKKFNAIQYVLKILYGDEYMVLLVLRHNCSKQELWSQRNNHC